MPQPVRVLIPSNIRQLFDEVYRAYSKEGYQHIQALKKTRDDILSYVESQARAQTAKTQGFFNTLGQMANNAQALSTLDAQLNALIVENL